MGEAPKMATVRLSAARSIYCRVSLCRNQNFLQDVTIFSIENASVLSLQKKKIISLKEGQYFCKSKAIPPYFVHTESESWKT